MNELYKGYVPSNNKIPACKYTDSGNLKTLSEIQKMNPNEYMGVLGPNTVLIDFDDMTNASIALKLIVDNQLKCKVIQTKRGIHVLMESNKNFSKSNNNKQLACGLIADIKLGSKNGLECLKQDGAERIVLYDTTEYEEPPVFFYPTKTSEIFPLVGLKEGEGRNSTLYKYLIELMKIMDIEKSKKTAEIINEYVFTDKLSPEEFAIIVRDGSFSRIETSPDEDEFFSKKGEFFFEKFAHYLVDDKKVIKINNQLYIYQDGVYTNGIECLEREMIKTLPHLSRAKRKEVLEYLKLLVEKDENTSDYNQYILFRNGIYDIVTEQLTPFDSDIIITNKINWDYNPEAYSPIIDDMLNKLTCNDDEIRAILEEMIGYCFFRQNELGKAFILTGPKANGKSTFQSILQKLLGRENIASVDLKDLGERFIPAELYGKLANIGDDIGDGYIDDSNMFKTIVTGGRIIAERKGQDPFEFEPYTKCIFSANNIPKTRDRTGAVKRRLIIIPFDRVFSPTDADYDPYISYKIKNGTPTCTVDDNMSYLINIGIAGLKRVLKNNSFTQSVRVDAQIAEYDKNNNPILFWFDELGTKQEAFDYINYSETKSMYSEYLEFCSVNGIKSLSKIEFGKCIFKEFGLKSHVKYIDGHTARIYVADEDEI